MELMVSVVVRCQLENYPVSALYVPQLSRSMQFIELNENLIEYLVQRVIDNELAKK